MVAKAATRFAGNRHERKRQLRAEEDVARERLRSCEKTLEEQEFLCKQARGELMELEAALVHGIGAAEQELRRLEIHEVSEPACCTVHNRPQLAAQLGCAAVLRRNPKRSFRVLKLTCPEFE